MYSHSRQKNLDRAADLRNWQESL